MIKFRAIEESDLSQMCLWRNAKDVFPFVREYRALSIDDQKEWFEAYRKQRRRSDWDQELMVMNYEGANDIGVGGFVRMEWRNRKAEFSYYIGNEHYRTKDIIWESIINLLTLGFNVFNLNKVYWPVYSHDPNIGNYTKIFKEEAVLKEEYFWDGEFKDRYYLSITKKEFDKLLI